MLDLDDLTIDNAYFRSVDMIVRRMLDPVWHKVDPRTEQLVSDLATLRRLLTYLLTYNTLAFHACLETLITANMTTDVGTAAPAPVAVDAHRRGAHHNAGVIL
ncbi:hypothetical protein BN946_scf184713.g3 [Trametes cinnabarina]|uniref:Uncharacterized protein n=1 Tax=Pycnoporus cinnabarinus TaxID=5643 RepID=A0A060STW9_PYCCI|nr:hypothetical protein BN946_scf184713.g3 [Trametes cinnabarina]